MRALEAGTEGLGLTLRPALEHGRPRCAAQVTAEGDSVSLVPRDHMGGGLVPPSAQVHLGQKSVVVRATYEI